MKKNIERELKTSNKIAIYHVRNPHLHSFSLALYAKAGVLYESDEINGSTHLWEHMLYRKLNQSYNNKFSSLLDKCGLYFSATTYKEFLCILIKGSPKYFDLVSEIMLKIFDPMDISSDEFKLEKKRVKAEIREGDQKTTLRHFTDQIIWADTNLKNMITGTCKSVDSIGNKKLQEIQDSILSQGNIFFYITGAFENQHIEKLRLGLEQIVISEPVSLRDNTVPVNQYFFHRNNHISIKNSKYHALRFSFDFNNERYSLAEIDLIYDILFSGEMGKIHQELSEQRGLIYSFNSTLERYRNIGNLHFSFDINKAKIFETIKVVVDLLNHLKKHLDDELSFVIPWYTENAEFIFDDDAGFNWEMAYERHIMEYKYDNLNEKIESYKIVTPKRIMQIANEIFVPNNTILTLSTNKSSFDFERAKSILDLLG